MKIAELYAAVKFQIEGDDQLPKIDERLDETSKKVGKLALGLDVLTAGLGYMADIATNTAVGLHKFALSTGLSTQELQQWQHTAALSNVSAKEMEDTLVNLQSVHSKMVLQGGSAAVPWLLLGISPSEKDPFKMLEVLNKAFNSVDKNRVAMARNIAEMAGLGPNMFQMLRRKDLPIDALKEMYVLTDQDQQKLVTLNREWLTLTDQAQRASNVFMAEMAPALTRVLDLLIRVVDKVAEFVHAMQTGDSTRHFFEYLVVGIGAASVALTAFAAALKTASVVLGVFNTAAAPWIVTIGLIAAGALAAADAVVVLDAAFKNYHKGIGGRNTQSVLPGYDPSTPDGKPRAPRTINRGLGVTEILGLPSPRGGGASVSPIMMHIEKIQIDGSKDPKSTGRAVVDALTSLHLTYAGSQAPAPSL